MNVTRAEYTSVIKQLEQLSLGHITLLQNIKDLEGRVSYQTTSLTSAYERIEELEQIVNEELS